MAHAFEPVYRQSLSDDVAQRITNLIQSGGYVPGSRLPTISQMAHDFAVGAPTLREALKKLETVGIVAIRHGSGVYVGRSPDTMFVSNPIFGGAPTKKQLVDLLEARIPIETRTTALAAANATDLQLKEMATLLDRAAASFDDPTTLSETNMAFHRHIALSSGNAVLFQILDVLSTLFRQEQRVILEIHGRKQDDHGEHVDIFKAIQSRDVERAAQRMQSHLERVRDVIMKWESDKDPIR